MALRCACAGAALFLLLHRTLGIHIQRHGAPPVGKRRQTRFNLRGERLGIGMQRQQRRPRPGDDQGARPGRERLRAHKVKIMDEALAIGGMQAVVKGYGEYIVVSRFHAARARHHRQRRSGL